jgi:hypothetical protein
MRMPMKVEYTLPGLIPRPVAPPVSPETAGESFRAKLETLRGASVPVDWREILQLETRPAGAQHIGPPPRPADMRVRDGVEERGYWRRMLDSRLRAFEISKPGPEATPRDAAAVGRMMSLLAGMQQAADEVVARHLSEEPR